MTKVILYTIEDGQSKMQLISNQGPVSLSQRQMPDLFDVSSGYIRLHLKNIYDASELQSNAINSHLKPIKKEKHT
jgi:hypothetical protein